MFPGRSASPGIAIGKAVVIQHAPLVVEKRNASADTEIRRLHSAIETSKKDLQKILERAQKVMGPEEAAIFESHVMLLEDPEVLEQTVNKIKTENVNAEYAFKQVIDQFVAVFEAMEDEYMRSRAADVQDIGKRVLSHLSGRKMVDLSHFEEDVVLLTDDLSPSEFALMDLEHVTGFVTEKGGRTSHVAIMARTLEVPAVVGVKGITEQVGEGSLVAFDGDIGEVFVDPDQSMLTRFQDRKQKLEKLKMELKTLVGKPSVTADGHKVILAGNIGTPSDVPALKSNDAEGVGLYRTEFLYMDRSQMPSEEEQYTSYKTVLEACSPHMVVIRTLDIGGDKKLPYFKMDEEENPFLGNRAIRLCLQNKDMFRVQLRALMRASAHGNLAIMFPMISSLEELLEAKALLEDVRTELKSEGVKMLPIQVGIMIEIPSAALISDVLAKHCDFFSIGTNDLIQYTCAVDRMNKNLESLYNPYHPGVLRLIKLVIDNAHKENKWVGVCGEVGGKLDLVPLLLGMGLDEFSMSPPSVLAVRKLVRSLNYASLKTKVADILASSTGEEVEKKLKNI